LRKYDWDRYTVAEQLIDPGERILDIGCGEGYLLRKLKDKFEELYGMDVSPSRLREAEAKIKELYPSEVLKFKFVEGNADDSLPFPNNLFDVIITRKKSIGIEDMYIILLWTDSVGCLNRRGFVLRKGAEAVSWLKLETGGPHCSVAISELSFEKIKQLRDRKETR